MGELDTVAKHRTAFLRLVGTEADDPALTELGEGTDEVVYLYLTRGTRAAQRWMLDMGYQGWRKRSSALVFTGTDDADGGRSTALPSDFLRAAGHRWKSALREADGTPWGVEVTIDEELLKGDGWYIKGAELWLNRTAAPPTTLFLEFHYRHPEWNDSVVIDFPLEARSLIIAEAANEAKEENWLPGGPEMETKIERALARARQRARDVARPTKEPRHIRKPVRIGNRW